MRLPVFQVKDRPVTSRLAIPLAMRWLICKSYPNTAAFRHHRPMADMRVEYISWCVSRIHAKTYAIVVFLSFLMMMNCLFTLL
ncbi:hypothetical protein CEXT_557951 [Caerostris extrusa]|uniref:Uncharacterized protein n=1 Tax=Caerostris extrusa TaxID=172846 RepID=A0AAV4PUP2_CAEEX|nr:hypothetical protein CEXT_557951 [Caerostris extrusa]